MAYFGSKVSKLNFTFRIVNIKRQITMINKDNFNDGTIVNFSFIDMNTNYFNHLTNGKVPEIIHKDGSAYWFVKVKDINKTIIPAIIRQSNKWSDYHNRETGLTIPGHGFINNCVWGIEFDSLPNNAKDFNQIMDNNLINGIARFKDFAKIAVQTSIPSDIVTVKNGQVNKANLSDFMVIDFIKKFTLNNTLNKHKLNEEGLVISFDDLVKI
jgi:hypothetical protein